jgi:hypothetical protein
LLIVMFSVPPLDKSLARRAACNTVGLTNIVTRALPFTRTVEPGVKLVPKTFNVSAAAPAGKLGGETVPPPGTGLFTTNVATNEIPAPGLLTATTGVPARAMALAGIAASS